MARVLLVDDDEFALRATRRVLERAGHDVETALGAFPALDLLFDRLPAREFELVLVDLLMPGVCGYDLVRLALERELLSGARVVVLSGSAALVPEDLRDVVSVVLDKPFEVDRLLAVVDELTRPTLPPGSAP